MSNPLTPSQINELKILVQRQRQALLGLMQAQQAEVLQHEPSDSEMEHSARVAATGINEADESLANLHELEIASYERALQRLGSGDYGVCSDCGGTIGYARLKAWPTALRCVKCQEVVERRPARV